MAYSVKDDIESEFKAMDFDASGAAVSSTEVTEFIVQADALIDSMVGSRYETPVTGSVSLSILKMISIWLVKSRILSIISVKTPQDKTKQDPDGPSLYKQAMDLLKQIKNGTLKLPDAVAGGNAGGMESYLRNKTIIRRFSLDRNDW